MKYLLSILFLTISLSAYDSQRAITNLAHEYAECAVFYFISYEGAVKSNKTQLAQQLKAAASNAVIAAKTLSNEEVTNARMQMSMKEQDELIKHNYSNFSILLLKYGESCKEALNSPEKRLQYWLDKND